MKLALALALLLPASSLLAACSEAEVEAAKKAADTTIEKVAGAANRLAQNVSELDLSALSAEVLKDKAGYVLSWSGEQLVRVKDSESAALVAAAIEQVLDAAGELLQAAADELPNRQETRERIEQLRAEHGDDSGVMEILDPVLARMSALLE